MFKLTERGTNVKPTMPQVYNGPDAQKEESVSIHTFDIVQPTVPQINNVPDAQKEESVSIHTFDTGQPTNPQVDNAPVVQKEGAKSSSGPTVLRQQPMKFQLRQEAEEFTSKPYNPKLRTTRSVRAATSTPTRAPLRQHPKKQEIRNKQHGERWEHTPLKRSSSQDVPTQPAAPITSTVGEKDRTPTTASPSATGGLPDLSAIAAGSVHSESDSEEGELWKSCEEATDEGTSRRLFGAGGLTAEQHAKSLPLAARRAVEKEGTTIQTEVVAFMLDWVRSKREGNQKNIQILDPLQIEDLLKIDTKRARHQEKVAKLIREGFCAVVHLVDHYFACYFTKEGSLRIRDSMTKHRLTERKEKCDKIQEVAQRLLGMGESVRKKATQTVESSPNQGASLDCAFFAVNSVIKWLTPATCSFERDFFKIKHQTPRPKNTIDIQALPWPGSIEGAEDPLSDESVKEALDRLLPNEVVIAVWGSEGSRHRDTWAGEILQNGADGADVCWQVRATKNGTWQQIDHVTTQVPEPHSDLEIFLLCSVDRAWDLAPEEIKAAEAVPSIPPDPEHPTITTSSHDKSMSHKNAKNAGRPEQHPIRMLARATLLGSLPEHAERALMKETRQHHRQLCSFLIAAAKTSIENQSFRKNLNITRFIADTMLHEATKRGWRASTTATKMGATIGAMSRLNLYTDFPDPIKLGEDQYFRDCMRRCSQQQNKAEVNFPHPISLVQVTKICEDSNTKTHIKQLLALTFALAARVGDVLGLARRDVSMKEGRLTVSWKRGKTAKASGPHTVAVSVPRSLRNWCTTLLSPNINKISNAKWLFDLPGERARDAIKKELRDAMRKVEARLELRSIRRGALQQMAKQIDEKAMMLISGHKRVNTLRRYLDWGMRSEKRLNEMTSLTAAVWDKAEEVSTTQQPSRPRLQAPTRKMNLRSTTARERKTLSGGDILGHARH